MWGLYFIRLIAYIPATPVTGYLTLTLRRIGFSTFNSNMLTVPSAALQIITMLALAFSSEYFNERTLHCIFGEFWILPLLAALINLPDGGREWSRFSIITLISGCKLLSLLLFSPHHSLFNKHPPLPFTHPLTTSPSISLYTDPYFHPIVSALISENTFDVKKRALTAATYNVIVQIGSLIGSQIYRRYDAPYYHQRNKVLISICALTLVTFVVQSLYLRVLNKRKERIWDAMTVGERAAYQEDRVAREKEGNKRLDFRFKR